MALAPVFLEIDRAVQRVAAGETVVPEKVRATFARARSFLLDSNGLFREVEQTLVTDAEGLQKLELARQEIDFSRESLDKLEEATLAQRRMVLKEKLDSFLACAHRCNEHFAEFAQMAAELPIYSPIPAFDGFIKAGIKVMEGHQDPVVLHERMSNLLPELGRLERLVGMLEILHPDVPEEIRSALGKGLTGLQSGFGALAQYFETGQEPTLEDALKLVGSSTTILADYLSRAEDALSAQSRFTSFRSLEEWLRLQESKPDIPLDWVVGTVSDLFASWDFLLHTGERLLFHPLLAGVEVEGGLTTAQWPAHKQCREQTGQVFAEVEPENWLDTPHQTWLDLRQPLERLQREVEASQKALEEQMDPFRELPGLERIATLKEQVKRGEVEPDLLSAEFDDQLNRVEELLSNVNAGSDPVSYEFAQVLPIHRGAFLGMKENLAQGDWEGLESRWQGILTTLPHLAALSRAVRMRVESQSTSRQKVTCVRCGDSQEAGRRVCTQCGANLPTVIKQYAETAEVSHGDAPAAPAGGGGLSARALEMLEALVQGVEANTITRDQARKALEGLIAEVDKIRKTFAAKVLPLMGKDQTLDAYLRYFAQAMGAYFGGIMQMYEYTEGGSLAQLHSGLATCRETLATLEDLKAIIDEALRG